jgi:glutamine synthetase
MSFTEKYQLRDEDQQRAIAEVIERIEQDDLEVVRFSFADQHGILRGKTLSADAALDALTGGYSITSTLLLKDTSHRSVYPVFSEGSGLGSRNLEGGADLVMVADAATFRVLPWAPGSGWILCDLYFGDGEPVPFSTRQLCRSVLEQLGQAGYQGNFGLEVEFHIFKLEDEKLAITDAGQPGEPGEPPRVSLLSRGYQYLTENRYDQVEPVIEIIRRDLAALGLPVRSIEVEFGPSQFEFTFQPGIGLEPADSMVLLRSAIKQICHRNGYHATFMCRPGIPNAMASGWHLHQSLIDIKTGRNVFAGNAPTTAAPLSDTGMNYLGGMLEHAAAGAAFSAPTVNGYRRFQANSLAPDRAVWGLDNRGVMARVLAGDDDSAVRIENRIGEPAANPYLYLASQVIAGLDGIENQIDPGPPTSTPYECDADLLPTSLEQAIKLLSTSRLYRDALGSGFVDYFCHIKQAEIARFHNQVTDWEQREYFDVF